MAYLLIPLLGALAGGLIALMVINAIFSMAKRRKGGIIGAVAAYCQKELLSGEQIAGQLEKIDFGPDAVLLLDKHLELLVVKVHEKIPMAAMFLSGSLVDGLKGLAREELLKALPEIKQAMGSRLLEGSALKTMLEEGLQRLDMDQLMASVKKGCCRQIGLVTLLGAVVGLLVGLLQLAILHLVK